MVSELGMAARFFNSSIVNNQLVLRHVDSLDRRYLCKTCACQFIFTADEYNIEEDTDEHEAHASEASGSDVIGGDEGSGKPKAKQSQLKRVCAMASNLIDGPIYVNGATVRASATLLHRVAFALGGTAVLCLTQLFACATLASLAGGSCSQ